MSNIEDANVLLVYSKNLASALLFCTNEKYQKHDKDGGGTVYTFKNSAKLRECMNKIKSIKENY